MRYATEVIGLMAAYPGRDWRMIEIVRHVAKGRPHSKQQRDRYRQGVLRVIRALVDADAVRCKPGLRGQPALYRWKKCDTQFSQSATESAILGPGHCVL